MKTDWQRLASIGICFTLVALFVFLAGKYLLAVFVPFIIAWVMAFFSDSVSRRIYRKLKLPKKLCSALVLASLFVIAGGLIFLSANRFITEVEKFIGRITADGGALLGGISQIAENLDGIGSHIPLIGELKSSETAAVIGEQADRIISSFVKEFASDVGAALTKFATAAVKALPSILLSVLITVIASFYFALDFATINRSIYAVLPPSVKRKLPAIKLRTRSLAARYLKAYSILMALTFTELYAGLTVIGTDYAFLLALGISFLDVLPILGVGTVLIPWALISFIGYDFGRGVGLIVLWAAVTVIRQLTEPRIVGGTIGLHPAVTLIGMYVGFRLFGIAGMFFAPAAIIASRAYLENRITQKEISAIDSVAKK